jgi:hypothetical protein
VAQARRRSSPGRRLAQPRSCMSPTPSLARQIVCSLRWLMRYLLAFRKRRPACTTAMLRSQGPLCVRNFNPPRPSPAAWRWD